jgi:hypothetical protein
LAQFDLLLGKAAEGRRKTLCATRRFLKYAKHLGLRQSSGALPADETSAKFPHELLCANDKMNCYISVTRGCPE